MQLFWVAYGIKFLPFLSKKKEAEEGKNRFLVVPVQAGTQENKT